MKNFKKIKELFLQQILKHFRVLSFELNKKLKWK